MLTGFWREGEKPWCERETSNHLPSRIHPDWGLNPQPRQVPLAGIKPTTFRFTDDAPIAGPHQPGQGLSKVLFQTLFLTCSIGFFSSTNSVFRKSFSRVLWCTVQKLPSSNFLERLSIAGFGRWVLSFLLTVACQVHTRTISLSRLADKIWIWWLKQWSKKKKQAGITPIHLVLNGLAVFCCVSLEGKFAWRLNP